MKQETDRESASDEPECRVLRLPFSDIPHQSQLFVQYQDDPLSLQKFYPNVLTSPAEIASYVPTALANYKTDRNDLCDVLGEINKETDAGERTFANIEVLRQSDSVAVITGQQAGLFSGPLYTIYKALSTVKLAQELSAKGINAVPVFWAATEDHDFEEVSEAFFIGRTGELGGVKYEPRDRMENTPVGAATIDVDLAKLMEEMFDDMPHSERSDEVRAKLGEIWSAGTRFGTAFGKTLAWVLGKFGIVQIDAMHKGIKRLSAPIYSAAIENVDEIVASVVDRGSELVAEGFHNQVLVEENYFPLFWHDEEGRRLALRKTREGVFRAKEYRNEFTIEELRQIAFNEPERFSPGVMLRPVVQDFLFPTACYFGGGAEVSYFAQNSEVYRVLGRPVTPVFHRQSFTVVEAKQRRAMEKFELDLTDLFGGKEEITVKLAGESVTPDTARLFAEVEERINTEMNRLDQAVSHIEPTLAKNVARRRQRIVYHIAALRKKTLLAKVRNDETAQRQIDELFASLWPNGGLQERKLNVFSYLNKHGLNFIDWIYDAIDLEDKEHRIIEL
ncbi:MAG: bacillithiol biosynthesis cysteine-adding enzyme BshC [Pyrinomonadaceae bacterium]